MTSVNTNFNANINEPMAKDYIDQYRLFGYDKFNISIKEIQEKTLDGHGRAIIKKLKPREFVPKPSMNVSYNPTFKKDVNAPLLSTAIARHYSHVVTGIVTISMLLSTLMFLKFFL